MRRQESTMSLEDVQIIARTSSSVQSFHDRMIISIEKSIGRSLSNDEKTAYLKGMAYENLRLSAIKA